MKHRYGKEDGRVCYHGYQSFKADEVDANTAHNIGVALARELWGDRFQVVIATHCNTGHYHNHFVINSVSDVDGLKFYNSPEDYRHMREVSDRLCREARISVIENPDGKRKRRITESGPLRRMESLQSETRSARILTVQFLPLPRSGISSA